ncbi:hypothetical protein N9K16_04620 [Alphaproteobacteria bacterium]|jgi:hypothetical protein|nr:hypothetical protein [Alphaproteobacteria bacterium]
MLKKLNGLIVSATVLGFTAFTLTHSPEPSWAAGDQGTAQSNRIYKTDFWSGEWPPGFTVQEDTYVSGRPSPDSTTSRTIRCSLEKSATYHPWNQKRSKADNLQFFTIQTTQAFVVKSAVNAYVSDPDTNEESTIQFKKGDEWTFLTYYGEGFYRMSFKGQDYVAEQDLSESSVETTASQSNEPVYEQWLGLPCDNNIFGWLLLEDLTGNDAIGEPNVPEYGAAVDGVAN